MQPVYMPCTVYRPTVTHNSILNLIIIYTALPKALDCPFDGCVAENWKADRCVPHTHSLRRNGLKVCRQRRGGTFEKNSQDCYSGRVSVKDLQVVILYTDVVRRYRTPRCRPPPVAPDHRPMPSTKLHVVLFHCQWHWNLH